MKGVEPRDLHQPLPELVVLPSHEGPSYRRSLSFAALLNIPPNRVIMSDEY